MKNREWFEDSLHEVLSMCLPHLEKSNIRPAYQKTKMPNPFAVNHMDKSDMMKDGLRAARNYTDIVYFWLHFDPLDFLSTEVDGDTVSSIIPFKLTVSLYGKNSMPNAIRVKSFLRTPASITYLLTLPMVVSAEPTITTFSEEINGEWWERTDVDINLTSNINDLIDKESLKLDGDGKGYSLSTDGEIKIAGGN